MGNLLSANFMRLKKSKAFWLCAVFTLLISASLMYWVSGFAREMAERGYSRPLEAYYFTLAPYTGAISAIFISLFLGTEYSDGTIRNKLIVGHTRVNIYLANLLTCLMGGMLITALWFLGGLPGVFLIGNFEMEVSEVIAYFFVSLGFTAVFTAIYVWVSSLSGNKAVTVVLVMVIWVALSLMGSAVYDRLHEPEFNGGMAFIDGEFVIMEDTPNPLYLTGGIRTAVELLYRILPTGQAIAMTSAEITTPGLDIAISLAVSIVVTVIGMMMFHRKDLK